jgi:hypothetical protein
MQGYNTGWKTRYFAVSTSISSGSAAALAANSGRPLLWQSVRGSNYVQDRIKCGDYQIEPIMTHGYNSIRLRWAHLPAALTSQTDYSGVITYDIFLVESDVEEDQVPSYYSLTPLVSVATNLVYPTNMAEAPMQLTGFFTEAEKWKYCNQIRVVDSPLLGADTNTSADTGTEAYAAGYIGGALGIDLINGASTIDTTGVPVGANIINRKYRFSAYSPGFATDQTTSNGRMATAAGELYINGLAGASRLLVVPMLCHGSQVINHWSNTTVLGANAANAAKFIALSYNLIQ